MPEHSDFTIVLKMLHVSLIKGSVIDSPVDDESRWMLSGPMELEIPITNINAEIRNKADCRELPKPGGTGNYSYPGSGHMTMMDSLADDKPASNNVAGPSRRRARSGPISSKAQSCGTQLRRTHSNTRDTESVLSNLCFQRRGPSGAPLPPTRARISTG